MPPNSSECCRADRPTGLGVNNSDPCRGQAETGIYEVNLLACAMLHDAGAHEQLHDAVHELKMSRSLSMECTLVGGVRWPDLLMSLHPKLAPLIAGPGPPGCALSRDHASHPGDCQTVLCVSGGLMRFAGRLCCRWLRGERAGAMPWRASAAGSFPSCSDPHATHSVPMQAWHCQDPAAQGLQARHARHHQDLHQAR